VQLCRVCQLPNISITGFRSGRAVQTIRTLTQFRPPRLASYNISSALWSSSAKLLSVLVSPLFNRPAVWQTSQGIGARQFFQLYVFALQFAVQLDHATAIQPMTTLQHTDAAFASGPPTLPDTEPTRSLQSSPLAAFAAPTRHRDSRHSHFLDGLLIL
jgi:hypothetical protein